MTVGAKKLNELPWGVWELIQAEEKAGKWRRMEKRSN